MPLADSAFDHSHTRTRQVSWQDPAATRAQAAGLSGLEVMRAIRDKTLPPPPMARVIGFECVVAEMGEIVMELAPEQSLENAIGLIHGGAAAAMLDTAMGAAVSTVCEPDQTSVTLDLSITYLRPLTLRSGAIRASARVLNKGRRTAYVVGEVHDGNGRLAAHAVANFSIIAA